ncbi:MAG: hypothetical protein NVS9B15_20990 [Acidobacteriaceae bacterium]
MTAKIERYSLIALFVLSLVALGTVITGFFQPPQPDEGTAAHIFQLSIAAFVPALLLFICTADRKRPMEIARRITVPAAILVIAFAALYHLEHR